MVNQQIRILSFMICNSVLKILVVSSQGASSMVLNTPPMTLPRPHAAYVQGQPRIRKSMVQIGLGSAEITTREPVLKVGRTCDKVFIRRDRSLGRMRNGSMAVGPLQILLILPASPFSIRMRIGSGPLPKEV
ncbi:hypothetical protein VNO77_08786 [Canavalia gladiata]|uniref:Uncharacterized protein n=1 Tax=Canavalia gladiata TaxID=3824 RepID=A0AAN9QTX2_CANGL